MNNRIKLYFANFLVMTAGLWMASCSASDDNLVSDKGADVAKNEKVLTLRINTGATSFGSRTTDITTDPGTAAENTINRLTIGIFDSNGANARCIKELVKNGGTDVFTMAGTTATATITASSFAAGDKVLVAVNAPASTFSGVSTATEFNAKTEGTVAALTFTAAAESENTVEEKDNIPMYGEGALTGSGKNFSAAVTVKHLLSKITLESLSVDFDKGGSYSAATFTPMKIFLINEPDGLVFNNEAWKTSVQNTFQGYKNGDPHGTYKECLTTQDLGVKTPLSGDSKSVATCKFASNYFFYTMPNNEIDASSKNTKLVIEGKFMASGTTNEETVYYPVALNAKYEDKSSSYVAADPNTTVYKVYPNKNYKCTVVIKAKGAASPFDNLDPKKATITVTVSSFTDVTQTTVFK